MDNVLSNMENAALHVLTLRHVGAVREDEA